MYLFIYMSMYLFMYVNCYFKVDNEALDFVLANIKKDFTAFNTPV